MVVSVRPAKDKARDPFVVKLSIKHYFERGGFFVYDDEVCVENYWGNRHCIDRARVARVVVTKTWARGNDWRVLLIDGTGAVLIQDVGQFYSDKDAVRLAEALNCVADKERFRSVTELQRSHPGVFRYPLVGHPIQLALIITAVLFVAIFAVIAVAAALGLG